jgi:multidrug efflux pump subunit AcrA (membrane-fusion protein)
MGNPAAEAPGRLRPPRKSWSFEKLLFWRVLSRRQLAATAAVSALVVLVPVLFLRSANKEDYAATAYVVKRSDLVINVLEGGSLAATHSQEIKCGVEGQTTIISVVPDGYVITDEDVAKGKVLLELDSSSLREKAIQQNITFQDAASAYTQAKEQLDIQKNQNESDVSAAGLQADLARMDLEKFLGVELTATVLKEDAELAPLMAGQLSAEQAAALLGKLKLGGAAWQNWQNLQSNIDLAGEDVARAKMSYQWSRKLGPKIGPEDKLVVWADETMARELGLKTWPEKNVKEVGCISQMDVEADAHALRQKLVAYSQAQLSLEIFLRYDFAKQTRTFLSAYTEATRQLERAQAKARSSLAMAEVNLKTREESLKIQQDHLDKVNKQVAECTIRATKPGMVVYPAASPYRDQDTIVEGATVRERQIILTVPDFAAMEVNVRVHEASADKIKPGQQVKVVVEALPNMTLSGEVKKMATMPEQLNWMSPDVKVFTATVALKDAPVFLKPGMSAQAEIIVDRVADAIAVPVQAVFDYNGRKLCYVLRGSTPEPRLVETGAFNNKFIQVVKGISEGDRVLLREPTIPDAVLAKLVAKQEPAAPKTPVGPVGKLEGAAR